MRLHLHTGAVTAPQPDSAPTYAVSLHFHRPAELSARWGFFVSDNQIMNNIDITIRPASITPSSQRYEAHCGGELLATSRTPFFAAARALLERGHSPQGVLTMRHAGQQVVALRATLGKAAGVTVIENETAGPRLGRYRTPPADMPTAVVRGRVKTAGKSGPAGVAYETAGVAL